MDETPTFVDDVDIVGDDGMGLLNCRRKGRSFHVPRYNLLAGAARVQRGVRAVTLVLPRWCVDNLGLLDEEPNSGLGRAHLHDAERAGRILVVDADAECRDTLCALLECWGHHVVSADSGQQALGVAVEMRLDSIVFNLMLPDLDGAELGRTIRALHLAPPPQLVAYSSLPLPDDLAVDAFIQKPDVRALERLFGTQAGQRSGKLPHAGRRR